MTDNMSVVLLDDDGEGRQVPLSADWKIGEITDKNGQFAFTLISRGFGEQFRTVYPDDSTVHIEHLLSHKIALANIHRRRSGNAYVFAALERWLADPEHRTIEAVEA
jgi:hypothetical protein